MCSQGLLGLNLELVPDLCPEIDRLLGVNFLRIWENSRDIRSCPAHEYRKSCEQQLCDARAQKILVDQMWAQMPRSAPSSKLSKLKQDRARSVDLTRQRKRERERREERREKREERREKREERREKREERREKREERREKKKERRETLESKYLLNPLICG